MGAVASGDRCRCSARRSSPPSLLRSQRVDVVVAMGVAGLVNLAMLVLAARLFFGRDLPGIDTLEGAHAALQGLAGESVALAFAVALLASGFASSGVGT